MRAAVEVERQNITHNYHLGIFASHWFNEIVTNDVAKFSTAYGTAYGPRNLSPDLLQKLPKEVIEF